MKNVSFFLSQFFSFLEVKFSIYRRVFVMWQAILFVVNCALKSVFKMRVKTARLEQTETE